MQNTHIFSKHISEPSTIIQFLTYFVFIKRKLQLHYMDSETCLWRYGKILLIVTSQPWFSGWAIYAVYKNTEHIRSTRWVQQHVTLGWLKCDVQNLVVWLTIFKELLHLYQACLYSWQSTFCLDPHSKTLPRWFFVKKKKK